MSNEFFANFDLAALAIWAFWVFFALLVYYLQRENMREGYPLEDDDGNVAANQGPFPVPSDKTFILPHGEGTKKVPSEQTPERANLPLERMGSGTGYPFMPTGDPMADGVGPASWAPRKDKPELDGHGHPKIGPLSANEDFTFSCGFDPRGMRVFGGDKTQVGVCTDMWIDAPEQVVRYIEIELNDGGKRLAPMTLCKMSRLGVMIKSLYSHQFPGVPQTKSNTQITLLEEDKIVGYYGGGTLYATRARFEPLIG
ncbi:MAG: photosynthetic reaction center subunit H [Pseudomonadota bacterium]